MKTRQPCTKDKRIRAGTGYFKKSLGHFQPLNIGEVYQFIRSNEKKYPCQLQCRMMEVSRSGYYVWRKGETHQEKQTSKAMEQKVIDTFWEHKRRYGARRISQTLQSPGEAISRYKAGKVLGKHGLKAIQPRSFVPKTTDSRHAYKISPNLLLNKAFPKTSNAVWVGDITYIPLAGGRWCYTNVKK